MGKTISLRNATGMLKDWILRVKFSKVFSANSNGERITAHLTATSVWQYFFISLLYCTMKTVTLTNVPSLVQNYTQLIYQIIIS